MNDVSDEVMLMLMMMMMLMLYTVECFSVARRHGTVHFTTHRYSIASHAAENRSISPSQRTSMYVLLTLPSLIHLLYKNVIL